MTPVYYLLNNRVWGNFWVSGGKVLGGWCAWKGHGSSGLTTPPHPAKSIPALYVPSIWRLFSGGILCNKPVTAKKRAFLHSVSCSNELLNPRRGVVRPLPEYVQLGRVAWAPADV